MTGMKPFKTLLSRVEALGIIEGNTTRIGRTEEVPIKEASGRVLVEDVVADFSVPPFDRSAMDGYAVRAEDTYGASGFNPNRLKLIGVQHAGELFDGTIGKGECVQVATGSPVPEGSDAVVMVEFTRLDGDYVEIQKPAYPSANTSPMGEDIETGDTVIEAGETLTPAKVGALAALNRETIRVYGKPRVAVFSTGSEIKPLGSDLSPSQIYDVNSYTLTSVISGELRWGPGSLRGGRRGAGGGPFPRPSGETGEAHSLRDRRGDTHLRDAGVPHLLPQQCLHLLDPRPQGFGRATPRSAEEGSREDEYAVRLLVG